MFLKDQPLRYLSWRKMHLSQAKLRASSKTSALLAGFAMIAMVEIQINGTIGNGGVYPTHLSERVLIGFAVCTTLLVAVHMLALMISTCILPNIDAISSLDSPHLVHESPHERLHWYVEMAWAFSTLLGLLLFLVEIALICWIKFYEISPLAGWSAAVLLVPVLILFLAFAGHFYRSLTVHKYNSTLSQIRELEFMKQKIENSLIV